MDANTYYLNQYMADIEANLEMNDPEYEAQKAINDPDSDFYPWTSDRVFEALSQNAPKPYDRIAELHADDRELAKVVREMVLHYWLENAREYFKN